MFKKIFTCSFIKFSYDQNTNLQATKFSLLSKLTKNLTQKQNTTIILDTIISRLIQ